MAEIKRENDNKISLRDIANSLTKQQRETFLNGFDLKNFAKIFEDDYIMDTCNCLFDNNLNVSETARSLYMHRNTLMYRLNKIKNITGLDIKNFSDAVTFLMLHTLYSVK